MITKLGENKYYLAFLSKIVAIFGNPLYIRQKSISVSPFFKINYFV